MSFSNQRITNAHELNKNSGAIDSTVIKGPINAYENALIKFAEYLDQGEFEKA